MEEEKKKNVMSGKGASKRLHTTNALLRKPQYAGLQSRGNFASLSSSTEDIEPEDQRSQCFAGAYSNIYSPISPDDIPDGPDVEALASCIVTGVDISVTAAKQITGAESKPVGFQ